MARGDRRLLRHRIAACALTLALGAAGGRADDPRDLDQLIDLALGRDPAAVAALLDAEAARARAKGARQLESPQVMLGGEMLGGMESMYMAGAQQMFTGFGRRRARAARWEVAAERSSAERDVVRAELRLRFWQAAARLVFARDSLALIDEQSSQARALLEIGLARHASGGATDASAMSMGAGGAPGMAPMGGSRMPGPGGAMSAGTISAAPSGMGAMSGGPPAGGVAASGMPGMSGPSAAASRRVTVQGPSSPTIAPVGGIGTVAASDLPGLLRLDAAIERIAAERSGLVAQVEGEQAVLALFLGDDTAALVAAEPDRFLGGDPTQPPELRLADLDRDAADADLEIARSNRRPDVMVSVLGRMTPERMYEGTDLMVGVSVPVGGGLKQEVAAARAETAAAEARSEAVTRDLAVSVASLRSGLRGARARAEALASVAVPRANAAFLASRSLLAEGAESLQGAALSWDALLVVRRDLVAARLEIELRSAELARIGGVQ